MLFEHVFYVKFFKFKLRFFDYAHAQGLFVDSLIDIGDTFLPLVLDIGEAPDNITDLIMHIEALFTHFLDMQLTLVIFTKHFLNVLYLMKGFQQAYLLN